MVQKNIINHFRDNLLSNITKKKIDFKKNLVKLIAFLILMGFSGVLAGVFNKLIGLWIIPILIFYLAILIPFFVKYLNKFYNYSPSTKENLMYHLYQCLIYLKKYIKDKDIKDYHQSKKQLNHSRRNLENISFEVFGTEWEKTADSFIEDLILYFDVEIIPKLRVNAENVLLEELYGKLKEILETIIKDQFELKILKEFRKKFTEENETMRERILKFIQQSKFVKIFFSVTIMVISYFVIWGISILGNYEINAFLMIGISVAMPAAINYGILIFDKLFKRS